jgi:hypothetical protein
LTGIRQTGTTRMIGLGFEIGHPTTSFNCMKTPKKQTPLEDKKRKRDYVKPNLKKREQIKEVTEGDISNVTVNA